MVKQFTEICFSDDKAAKDILKKTLEFERSKTELQKLKAKIEDMKKHYEEICSLEKKLQNSQLKDIIEKFTILAKRETFFGYCPSGIKKMMRSDREVVNDIKEIAAKKLHKKRFFGRSKSPSIQKFYQKINALGDTTKKEQLNQQIKNLEDFVTSCTEKI